MKRVFIISTLLFFTAFANAQIIIGQLTEGVYFNEVVYQGSYQSPGDCTFADGIDFYFDFNGLTEVDGMQYVLVIDAPVPANTPLLNGWLPVNVGDSTVFTPSTTGLGISAGSGPATLNFHVRLIGTPTTAGQDNPCWISQMLTLANCGNSYGLIIGETPIACTVQSATSISDISYSEPMVLTGGQLKFDTQSVGQLQFYTLDGRLLESIRIPKGQTNFELSTRHNSSIARFEVGNRSFTQKILLP